MNSKNKPGGISDFDVAARAFEALKRVSGRKDLTRELPGLLDILETLEETVMVDAEWDATNDTETSAAEMLTEPQPKRSSGGTTHMSHGGYVYSSAGTSVPPPLLSGAGRHLNAELEAAREELLNRLARDQKEGRMK